MSGSGERRSRRIDFDRVNAAARANAETIARAFLPNGRREGQEWVFLPPWRKSGGLGSCKVNLTRGVWADFARDEGGDLVGLVAKVTGLDQRAAAIRLAESLGVDPYE